MSNHYPSIISALGLIAVLASPFAGNAAGAAEGTTATATPEAINTVCPMDGKVIDGTKSKMVMLTVGEGADAKKCHMAFCSEAECAEFKKDPGAVLKSAFIGPKGGDTRRMSTP